MTVALCLCGKALVAVGTTPTDKFIRELDSKGYVVQEMPSGKVGTLPWCSRGKQCPHAAGISIKGKAAPKSKGEQSNLF